jgi:molybdenum-dependent DNA-binding transcriptional regulator ModE
VKLYSGAITISATTTLKAAAQAADMSGNTAWSAIKSATFTKK